ncbi:MAG: hypothetical protein ABI685_07680 [Ferruginibacter sp.]
MQRRDFVKKTSFLTLGLGLGFSNIQKWYKDEKKPLTISGLAEVSNKLETGFQQLLEWMKANGWTAHLQQALGINLSLTGDDLKKELIKELDANKLNALRQNEQSGYDDFSGERLIQPGFPAYSLLHHTMASPRVRPQGVKEYLSLTQIDLLENYIYALSDWEQLRSLYQLKQNEELVFAVFAYEYRPAFKTPHHAYADMVFSRTGIARIGNEPLNYDKINRCHTAKPMDESRVKNVAVMPARYGLYIARKVKHTNLSLVRSDVHKGADSKDDRNDAGKFFLQPIRKVFNDDVLVDNAKLQFSELHKSEKLEKLFLSRKVAMKAQKPKPRFSKDLIEQDNTLRHAGSSFLVISQYRDLIRPAREDGQILFFKVPKHVEQPYDNRYFTALCTQLVEDVELLDGNKPNLHRIFNDYNAPRNKPLFVNITNKIKQDTTYSALPKNKTQSFENEMKRGDYYAPLFEDSICDGSVRVDVSALSTGKINGISKKCLPAFSIVTAPDFFPQVDPLDFENFDIAPGLDRESSFYEGGVACLATARIKPNPKMIDTKSDNTSETYLAVLSGSLKEKTGISMQRLAVYKNPASERGYEISGFLPDVASSVFAPGWDVTYCGVKGDIYIGTEGLGSPFIEDMKFCAALNGMWPATSPDASRTYQGSNEKDYRNPTAVPLLDHEIGICADGPAGKAHESWGWDGEQGPYLEKTGNKWKINFTDLGRADAVNNALDGKLDMSQLRTLKSSELIKRMECLKLCIHSLPQRNFRTGYKGNITGYTYLWLVSAEKVNWGKEDVAALGIPANLSGTNKDWITRKENARVNGEGYLYVFVNSAADNEDGPKDWAPDLKRRRLDIDGEQIYVCQVTSDPNAATKIAWAQIKKNGIINWQVK